MFPDLRCHPVIPPDENFVSADWGGVYRRLKHRIEASGVSVKSKRLGPETTGVFDGLGIVTNSLCDIETQCHNMVHAFGHVAQWSLETARCRELYETLYAAKDRKREDRPALERALEAFRLYEEQASEYAAWLLIYTGNATALESFTRFARADIEAIVIYHRDGVPPIWSEFFTAWQARAARGEIAVNDFVPRPIPPFTPRPIEPQEVVQGVRNS
jgi:hypothetical protein